MTERPGPGRRPRRTPAPGRRGVDPSRRAAGRPPSLSLEQILDASIELLDASGVEGFTLRGLGARLGRGVGSVYWYVDGKDELVDRATDEVLGRSLADAEIGPAQPGESAEQALGAIRRLGVAIFHQLERHPWVAPRLIGDVELRTNSLRCWDLVGQHLQQLNLLPSQQFYGSSAILNYVTGVSAAMGADPHPELTETHTRDEIVDLEIQRWFAAAPEGLPFVTSMLDQFRSHNEFDQFMFGLDLILDGLRLRSNG